MKYHLPTFSKSYCCLLKLPLYSLNGLGRLNHHQWRSCHISKNALACTFEKKNKKKNIWDSGGFLIHIQIVCGEAIRNYLTPNLIGVIYDYIICSQTPFEG